MKVIIATAAYNNIKYTKNFLASIRTSFPYEVLVINNGSQDDTASWLKENNYNLIDYKVNKGFSYAYNDALDYTFREEDNLLLFCGNDTQFRNNTIDHLVKALLSTDFEMFCGLEVLNKVVLSENEKALSEFKYKFSMEEKPELDEIKYSAGGMNHSCLIRKKSAFNKIGYYDVNYYPAYFDDNDVARRSNLLGVKYGTVESAQFYHFWSRTIYEGGLKKLNSERFELNRKYYIEKWGGPVGAEAYKRPFNRDNVKISSREYEKKVLEGFGVKD